MTLCTLSVVLQIPQETKYRVISNYSRSTSNNRSQAQKFNVPDIVETFRVAILRDQIKASRPSVTLFFYCKSCKDHNFSKSSGIFCSISLPMNPTVSGHEIFRTFIFRQVSLISRQKYRQSSPGIKLTA